MHARSTTGAGFTIVEVLIFLAISGLMFVLAINAMSGEQQRTEFETGVDTLRSQLNEELSNVADGNYSFLNNLSCTLVSGVPTYNSGAPDGSCTVIGEVLSFNNTTYDVLPVIGRNYITGTNTPATTLADATPQVNASEQQTITMPFGLQVADVASDSLNGVSGAPGAFGLIGFTSLESNSSGSGLSSGSQHVEIFMIPGSTFNDVTGTIDAVNGGLYECQTDSVCTGPPASPTADDINPGSGITFCVNSGTDGESALFTIGGVTSSTSANDQVFSLPGCVDG